MKKRTFSLDELNAYRVAYGKPIERLELLGALFKPFLVGSVLTYSLFYYWWLALILGVLFAFYSFRFIMPMAEKRVYEANAFRERHNFVNNMTQILTSPDRTMLGALETVTKRAKGEFQRDLYELQTCLRGAGQDEAKIAFDDFLEKYKEDVIFELFVEQLTTAYIEGRTNIETLKDIKSYYNLLKKRQEDFFARKKTHTYEFNFIFTIGFVLILAVTFSFGWSQFVSSYAHSLVGWIFSSVYLIVLGFFYHTYLQRLSDDKVMEVKV